MQDATRLTRTGDLQGATKAIGKALNLSGADAGEVIDVQARVVPDSQDMSPPGSPLPGVPLPPMHESSHGVGEEAFISGRFGSGASARDYKLYVPPAAGTRPLPLVVMLHGCTQNPDDFAAGTAMNDTARAEGFFVLYPAQSQKANPQRCWNWFKHTHQQRGRGEPDILARMTQGVIVRHGIDPSRVYVAGLSAGGAMAAILGQAYPDIFAAVGVHSGLAAGAARDLPGALQAMKTGGRASAPIATPVIVIHGDADQTVHPANGDSLFGGVTAGSAADATVLTERGREPGGHAWTRTIHLGPGDRPMAEYWKVHGAGHAWAGGRRGGSYTDPSGPDASAAMWRFFRKHALRPSPDAL